MTFTNQQLSSLRTSTLSGTTLHEYLYSILGETLKFVSNMALKLIELTEICFHACSLRDALRRVHDNHGSGSVISFYC